jgi:hypothetical protein
MTETCKEGTEHRSVLPHCLALHRVADRYVCFLELL